MTSPAWYCIPSARPRADAQACIDQWRSAGYKCAIYRDAGAEPVDCDLLLTGEYPGYAKAVNALVREVLAKDAECSWCITGGDDTSPDPNHTADEIARQCSEHFKYLWLNRFNVQSVHWDPPAWLTSETPESLSTFGVMQPTGDRWGAVGNKNAIIDRVAGSPWLGKEFCQRMYGGQGPLFQGYSHMFLDEELQEVAIMLGVFWQRPDLIHLHKHWGRMPGARPPEHLREVNSPEHWKKYGDLFRERKASRFPGHEPLAVECLVFV